MTIPYGQPKNIDLAPYEAPYSFCNQFFMHYPSNIKIITFVLLRVNMEFAKCIISNSDNGEKTSFTQNFSGKPKRA